LLAAAHRAAVLLSLVQTRKLVWRALTITLRRAVAPRGRRSILLLVLAMAAIPPWQWTFTTALERLDSRYRIEAASGLYNHDLRKFFYFLRYLGLYPVATMGGPVDYSGLYPTFDLADPIEDSEDGARRQLAEHGSQLIMDAGWNTRLGDHGRMFLYYPDALIRGTTRGLSVRPCHRLVFIGGLCALFFGFWWIRQALLGTVVVLLIGSNPFQLFEVYVRDNVFGWPISTAAWVLALHLPLLGRRPPWRYVWVVPLVTGPLLATVRTIRSEPPLIILSVAMTYLLLTNADWRRRLTLIGLLVASFTLAACAWNAYFQAKIKRTQEVVARAGGHPYAGPLRLYHTVWHSVWCGLGDFDKKHGYVWDDRIANDYALPILREQYHVDVPPPRPGHYFVDAYWDDAMLYPKLPEDLPHYDDVLQEKVLRDMRNDPLWYAGIVGHRIWRILSDTTPVQIAIRPWRLTLPMHGLVFLALLAVLIASRSWMLCKLLCFGLPLSLPALLIYSGGGMSYYSCYHVFCAAILCVLILQGALWWWRRARSRGRR